MNKFRINIINNKNICSTTFSNIVIDYKKIYNEEKRNNIINFDNIKNKN